LEEEGLCLFLIHGNWYADLATEMKGIEIKNLLRDTLSATTVKKSGLEKLFAYLDKRHLDLPESVEWLRLGLAMRDVYISPRWRAGLAAFGILFFHGLLYAYMRACVWNSLLSWTSICLYESMRSKNKF
jgi:hypothetical protein